MTDSKQRSRRANGDGALFQLKDGRWAGEITVWTAEGRKRRRVTAPTRTAAKDRLADLQKRTAEGATAASDKLTVGQWLTEWLAKEAKPTVRPRTYSGYAQIVEQHLRPALGHHLLRKLETRHVRDYMAAKGAETSASKGKSHGRTLSARSVQLHHAILRRALRSAMGHELIAKNVAMLVSPPSVKRAERQPLTPEQTAVFLRSTTGHRHDALFRVAMASGARQSELLGLKWDDVDFKTGTIRIERTLQRYDGAYHLDAPKTARSRRTIALAAPAMEALKRQRTAQKSDRMAAGEAWQGDTWRLVFADGFGGPLSGVVVTHAFQDALKRAGLPKVRFHDLRHGAATFLLSAGVDLRTTMEVLGHSDIGTTSNLYSHVLPQLKRDAADKLGNVLFG